jgi:hypothetical protein
MNWDKVGGFLVENGLPLLGGVLLGPAGAAGGKLIAGALGLSKDDPAAAMETLVGDPSKLVALRELETRNRHELETLTLQAEIRSVAEVNATYREEIKSEDAFVRRARPMFLYVVAFSILIEVLIALVVVLAAPERIGDLANLFGALSVPQSIAAAMAGVYLKKRSDDKAVAARVPPQGGLIQALAAGLAKGRK